MLSQVSPLSEHHPSVTQAPPGFYETGVQHYHTPRSPFIASEHKNPNKKNLLLAASGSVAAIKIPNICHELSKYQNVSVRIIFTKSSLEFLAGQSHEQPRWQSLLQIPNIDGIHLDEDEWIHPWVRGAPILHIELRRWADLMLIAPLSLDMLAKIVHGMCDNLLLSVVKAWDFDGSIDGKKKKIILAPAGNTAMYNNPITEKQLRVLGDEYGVKMTMGDGEEVGSEKGWFQVLPAGTKGLACGDHGAGAMASVSELTATIVDNLGLLLDVEVEEEKL